MTVDQTTGQRWPRSGPQPFHFEWMEETIVPQVGDSWGTKALMPEKRCLMASAFVDGKLYVSGGSYSGTRKTATWSYDPATDAWDNTLAALPTALEGAGSHANLNGRFHFVGGKASGYVATHYAYDPTADSWTTKAAIPAPAAYYGGASLNGKYYVVGGASSSGVVASVWVYDPDTDSWGSCADYPVANFFLAAASDGEYIYACGGQVPKVATLYRYDPVSDAWTTLAPMPAALSGHKAEFGDDGRLYVAGGVKSSDVDTVLAYDPFTDSWDETLPSLLTVSSDGTFENLGEGLFYCGGISVSDETNVAGLLEVVGTQPHPGWGEFATLPDGERYGHGATTAGGKLYVAGGYVKASGTTDTETAYTWYSNGLKYADNATSPNDSALAVYNDLVYVFGGVENTSRTAKTRALAIQSPNDIWYTKASLPEALSIPGGFGVIGDYFYWAGGYGTAESSKLYRYDFVNDSWSQMADMPAAVVNVGETNSVVKGKLYVAGGSTNSVNQNTNYVYDPSNDTWETKAPMPYSLHMGCVVGTDDKLYAICGVDENSSKLNVLLSYDPDSDLWNELTPPPEYREWAAATYYDGKIYLLGGWGTSNDAKDTVLVYDISSDSWTESTPMPTTRLKFSAVVRESSSDIYTIGGGVNETWHLALPKASTPTISDTVWEYDPDTDAWTAQTPLPQGADACPAMFAEVGGYIYWGGGVTAGDQVWRLNLSNGNWVQKTSMPNSRQGGEFSGDSSAVQDKLIYVAGGKGDANDSTFTLWRYNPDTDNWKVMRDLPNPRADHATLTYRDKLFVVGGASGGNPQSEVLRYNPATDQWKQVASLPEARKCLAAATAGDKIYAYGGSTSSTDMGSPTDTVWIFDGDTGEWAVDAHPPLPQATAGLVGTHLKGKVLITGGTSGAVVSNTDVAFRTAAHEDNAPQASVAYKDLTIPTDVVPGDLLIFSVAYAGTPFDNTSTQNPAGPDDGVGWSMLTPADGWMDSDLVQTLCIWTKTADSSDPGRVVRTYGDAGHGSNYEMVVGVMAYANAAVATTATNTAYPSGGDTLVPFVMPTPSMATDPGDVVILGALYQYTTWWSTPGYVENADNRIQSGVNDLAYAYNPSLTMADVMADDTNVEAHNFYGPRRGTTAWQTAACMTFAIKLVKPTVTTPADYSTIYGSEVSKTDEPATKTMVPGPFEGQLWPRGFRSWRVEEVVEGGGPISDGATLYWKLDDPPGSTSVLDDAGNYPGNVYGSVELGLPGHSGTSASIVSGSRIAATLSQVVQQFTLECWFKLDATSTFVRMLNLTDGYGQSLYVYQGKLCGAINNGSSLATSTQSVNDGAWHHGAMVRDSANVIVYLDGVEAARATSTQSLPGVPLFEIGHYNSQYGDGDFVVDEAAYYPVALSPELIASHSSPATNSVVTHDPFEGQLWP